MPSAPTDLLRCFIAVNGGCNSYRAARDRSHPSIRSMSVIVGYLLARGAKYTISVAAAVGDQERIEQLLRKDSSLARRLNSIANEPPVLRVAGRLFAHRPPLARARRRSEYSGG